MQLLLTPAEYAAIEAVRGIGGILHSQSEAVGSLLRREVAEHARDPACREALRLLQEEDAEPKARSGRPATPPKPPPQEAAQGAPEPSREAREAPQVAEKPPPPESRGSGRPGRRCGRCGFPVEGRVCPRCGRVQPGA